MHAGRVRLRPILMTTFALIAGMMPVAIGMGEGGEFYSPMAVAIIGGTIVSTMLTLLVVPSFYDSIEISRERFNLKWAARAAVGHPFLAFVTTIIEAWWTLALYRFIYRCVRWLFNIPPPEHPVQRAARLAGFEVPAGFDPYPAPWQKRFGWQPRVGRVNPYAARPSDGDQAAARRTTLDAPAP
jgi:hypothetical protein